MRRCLHRFTDEGALRCTSMAIDQRGKYLATGSEMGVVNVYNFAECGSSNKMQPKPIKALTNLTTTIDLLEFNPDSQVRTTASMCKHYMQVLTCESIRSSSAHCLQGTYCACAMVHSACCCIFDLRVCFELKFVLCSFFLHNRFWQLVPNEFHLPCGWSIYHPAQFFRIGQHNVHRWGMYPVPPSVLVVDFLQQGTQREKCYSTECIITIMHDALS